MAVPVLFLLDEGRSKWGRAADDGASVLHFIDVAYPGRSTLYSVHAFSVSKSRPSYDDQ